MALQPDPILGTTVTAPVSGGNAIAAGTQPDDNVDTVQIYNTSSVGAFVAVLAAPVAAPLTPGTAIYIPALGSQTIRIGSVASRGPYGTAAGEKTLYYNSEDAATTAFLRINYASLPGGWLTV